MSRFFAVIRAQRHGRRSAHASQGAILHAPVRQLAVAGQFRRDQSGRSQRDDREPGGTIWSTVSELGRRILRAAAAASSMKMVDLTAFRFGEDIANSPGRGRLSERADAAHSVFAVHPDGPASAAADRPALDQQVLHSGPEAEELVHQMVRRPGSHRVRDLLGQSRTPSSPARISPTICSRDRWPRSTRSNRRPASARSTRRLLHRRHPAREHARLHGGNERQAHRLPRRSSRRCSTFPMPAISRFSSTRTSSSSLEAST